ncbi:MAG: Formimidoyltetrahydrofolate cyclodeaminase [Solirubrobacterales bacterium]|nr:Formimidoyltetrahydrofolate cyclodeaminase [Solirubrobacterales bacterium]
MTPPTLLAVPNVSEGRDASTIAAVAGAFADDAAGGVRVLDIHSDADHHRSVFTLAGRPDVLVDALLRGARVALERIDVVSRAGGGAANAGQHPHVGALDVAPIVYLRPGDRGAACAAALVLGDRLGDELQLPVFLYGELSGAEPASVRTRSQLRRGGVAGLAARLAAGENGLTPDFGPGRMHPRGGATLLAARPPLVAFNLQLAAPATVVDARAIAEQIREGGRSGLPGVRALGLTLSGEVAQVSMNVERPLELPLARVIDAVRVHAEVSSAELVGLAPAAAFDGFPQDVPMPGFDPQRHLIENALGC